MKKILKFTFGLMLIFSMFFSFKALTKSKQTTQAFAINQVCAEIQNDNKSEVGSYFEDKVMPYVVSGATGFIIILIGLMPAIQKMLKIATDLKMAKETLKTSNTENLKLKQDIKDLQQANNEMKEMLNQLISISKIGFCNTKELVVNGYANEIAKVGTNNEENEK